MTEKMSLINSVAIMLAEDYNLNLKETKSKLTEILTNYHITISDEAFSGNNLTTEYLFNKFYAGKTATGMSEKTLQQYKIAIQKLENMTKKQFSDIEAEDITNFLKLYGKSVSMVTVKAKYQLLSSVYNWLFNHKYIPHNPMLFVESPRVTVVYKEPLSDLELEKIKTACEKLPEKESLRNMAIIYFFVSTGCRVSELCGIKLQDIDLDKKICTVMGKGRKERPVALTDRACYRIKLYLSTRKDLSPTAPLFAHIRSNEGFMTSSGLEKLIKKLKRLADVNKLTCHTFRRFYATELRRRNVNIQMIASSLGHANLNQINRYSLYNKSEMLDVIRNSM